MSSEALRQFKEEMEAWDRKLGLTQDEMDVSQIEVILKMDRQRVAELSAREAAEAAFVLAQFAFWLQRNENKCRAYMEGVASNDDPGLARLHRSAKAKVARIAFLGKRVEFMAQCLQAVQRTRYREEERA